MVYFFQQGWFVLNKKLNFLFVRVWRKYWYSFLGMKIGKDTPISKIVVNWPQKVQFGERCVLENNIIFKFDGIWSSGYSLNFGNNVFIGEGCEFNIACAITIDDNCLIASGCKFIDHDHGINNSSPMHLQKPTLEPISLGKGAWLGVNVIVLKGVSIGAGAVIGAGSVVTKSVGENEVWAGVPAKFIRKRD
jgi:acetyltransferase-like isoleucine patch superfamily enzyme